jgi:tetratricopeptide (TPR) repeat protein
MFKNSLCIVLLITIISLLPIVRENLENSLGHDFEKIEFRYTLPDEVLQLTSFGYGVAIGELFWLKSLQNMDIRNQHVRRFSYLYKLLDISSTLLPNYSPIYVGGGGFLSVIYWDYVGAEKLFLKGLKVFPNEIRLHTFLSMLYMLDLKEYLKSAQYMESASKIKGAPAWYKTLAARLYTEAQSPEIAIQILTSLYKSEKNIKTKKELARKIKLVMIDSHILQLSKLRKKYETKYGKLTKLNDLVTKGILKSSIPMDPFGGKYLVNNKGEIVSTSTNERYRPYKSKRGKRNGDN